MSEEKETVHLDAELIPIPSELFMIKMSVKGNAKVKTGYLLFTMNVQEHQLTKKTRKMASIWQLYVDPAFRKQGYAKAMVLTLQGFVDFIATQALVPESNALLLKMGFKEEIDRDQKYLVWKRPPKTII